jgi:hypothetical protein
MLEDVIDSLSRMIKIPTSKNNVLLPTKGANCNSTKILTMTLLEMCGQTTTSNHSIQL